MASPEYDPLIVVGLFILAGFALAFLVTFAVVMYFHFRSKQRINALEVVFKEQLELCKVNHNDNLRALWLIPVVPMFGIVDKIETFKQTVMDKTSSVDKVMCAGVVEQNGVQVLINSSLGSQIKNQIDSLKTEITTLDKTISKVLQNYRTGAAIYKGRIIGSNVIDKQATLEELYERTPNKDGLITLTDNATGEVLQSFTKDEVEALKEVIKQNGRHTNLIAYERETGGGFLGLFKKNSQFIVTAYDNQLLLPGMSREIELKAAAGDVSLLAPGTTRYGKFEFLTGYPQNTQLQAVELKCIVWTMVNRQIIGNISGAVQDAFDMNVGFSQGTTYKEIERPIQAQKPERGGG